MECNLYHLGALNDRWSEHAKVIEISEGGYPAETKSYLTPGNLASCLLNGHLEAPADENLCMN